MKKYLALLRGVNVGGKNKVEMNKLKTVFEDVGFRSVTTYINSGNIIFESDAKDESELASAVKLALGKAFDFEIQAVIRDSGNIRKLARAIPADWQNDDEQKTDVLFLWPAYDNKKSIGLIKQVEGIDNAVYMDGAIVWNIKKKEYGRSGMNKFISSELYKNMTARNVNTVRKLAVLMG